MKIVTPLSLSDLDKLETWLSCVEKFSGMDSHSIHFIPTHSVTAKAYEAAGRLGKICKDVRVSPLDMDNTYGWPKAPNWHWYKTVVIMEELSVPWFWMELDCLPVRQGWASEIGSAYSSSGMPFLGCVVPTPHKDPATGKEVPSPDGPEDKMMCGCGIYPSNILARVKQIQQMGLLDDLMKGSESADQPWDLHLRAVMTKIGMGHTPIIGDYWNTVNYRMQDGNLICDPKESHEMGSNVMVRRAGIINPAAVVIHGCKDDSLAKMILDGLDTRTLTPLPSPTTQDSSLKSVVDDPRIAAMEAQMAQMKAMLEQALKPKAEAKVEPIPFPTQDEIVQKMVQRKEKPQAQPKPDQSTDSPSDLIVQALKSSPKQLRLAQVSGITRLPATTIRELAQSTDCPFEIGKGPLGWMKLKTLTTA